MHSLSQELNGASQCHKRYTEIYARIQHFSRTLYTLSITLRQGEGSCTLLI